jgi:hypothetical protein
VKVEQEFQFAFLISGFIFNMFFLIDLKISYCYYLTMGIVAIFAVDYSLQSPRNVGTHC